MFKEYALDGTINLDAKTRVKIPPVTFKAISSLLCAFYPRVVSIFIKEKSTKGRETVEKRGSVFYHRRALFRQIFIENAAATRGECETVGKTILVNFRWQRSKSFACAKCGS